MAVLSAKDEEELAKIHRCEEFWQPQDDFKTLFILFRLFRVKPHVRLHDLF